MKIKICNFLSTPSTQNIRFYVKRKFNLGHILVFQYLIFLFIFCQQFMEGRRYLFHHRYLKQNNLNFRWAHFPEIWVFIADACNIYNRTDMNAISYLSITPYLWILVSAIQIFFPDISKISVNWQMILVIWSKIILFLKICLKKRDCWTFYIYTFPKLWSNVKAQTILYNLYIFGISTSFYLKNMKITLSIRPRFYNEA